VYHVKVSYVALHVTMGEGPIRSWHTKEAKCRERERESCSITKIRHQMLPTSKSMKVKLYIRIIVYGIYIHIPKVKPLAKHLRTSPPPFQHSQNGFQDYWGVPGLRKMDKLYAFSWELIDALLKYSNFYLFASHLIGLTKAMQL
jgi:hypothetical protein